MTKDQKGFAIIEVLLIIVIVSAVGGVGILAWHRQQEPHPSSNSTTIPSQTGKATLTGKLTKSPTCGGAQTPEQSCTATLANYEVEVIDTHDKVVTSTNSDTNGVYTIQIALGQYRLRLNPALYPAGNSQSDVVTVIAGVNHFDYDADTGIR